MNWFQNNIVSSHTDEMLLAASKGIAPRPYKELAKEVMNEQSLHVSIGSLIPRLPDARE